MSEPFDRIAPEGVEVALLGRKESAIHILAFKNRRRWTGSCKSARVTIKCSSLGS